MAPTKATVKAPGGGSAKGGGGGGAKAAAAPSAALSKHLAAVTRTPTWQQRLVVAIYIYFIPVFVALNAACLLSRWTAVPWLMCAPRRSAPPRAHAACLAHPRMLPAACYLLACSHRCSIRPR